MARSPFVWQMTAGEMLGLELGLGLRLGLVLEGFESNEFPRQRAGKYDLNQTLATFSCLVSSRLGLSCLLCLVFAFFSKIETPDKVCHVTSHMHSLKDGEFWVTGTQLTRCQGGRL
jgi:hypothetical protein